MDQQDPASQLAQGVAGQMTPGNMDWLQYLDPMMILKMLGLGGQSPQQPQLNRPVQQGTKRAGDLKGAMTQQPPPY